MTYYPKWTLPQDIEGAGESPVLEEFCSSCDNMTWHELSNVRLDTRSKAQNADLCALLWCCKCSALKNCFKADYIPPLPPGFEVREGRIVRQSP